MKKYLFLIVFSLLPFLANSQSPLRYAVENSYDVVGGTYKFYEKIIAIYSDKKKSLNKIVFKAYNCKIHEIKPESSPIPDAHFFYVITADGLLADAKIGYEGIMMVQGDNFSWLIDPAKKEYSNTPNWFRNRNYLSTGLFLFKGSDNKKMVYSLPQQQFLPFGAVDTMYNFNALYPGFKNYKMDFLEFLTIEKDGLKGMIDARNGKVYIPPIVQEFYVSPFSTSEFIDFVVSKRIDETGFHNTFDVKNKLALCGVLQKESFRIYGDDQYMLILKKDKEATSLQLIQKQKYGSSDRFNVNIAADLSKIEKINRIGNFLIAKSEEKTLLYTIHLPGTSNFNDAGKFIKENRPVAFLSSKISVTPLNISGVTDIEYTDYSHKNNSILVFKTGNKFRWVKFSTDDPGKPFVSKLYDGVDIKRMQNNQGLLILAGNNKKYEVLDIDGKNLVSGNFSAYKKLSSDYLILKSEQSKKWKNFMLTTSADSRPAVQKFTFLLDQKPIEDIDTAILAKTGKVYISINGNWYKNNNKTLTPSAAISGYDTGESYTIKDKRFTLIESKNGYGITYQNKVIIKPILKMISQVNGDLLLQLNSNQYFLSDYNGFNNKIILYPRYEKCEECEGAGFLRSTETVKTWEPGTYTTYTTKKDTYGNNVMVSETKKSSFNGSWTTSEKIHRNTCSGCGGSGVLEKNLSMIWRNDQYVVVRED